MSNGPFRTPLRPPEVPPHPSWGTVRGFAFIGVVVGIGLMGFLVECSGQWRRVDEVEPAAEPPPFCQTACETIGYRPIRTLRGRGARDAYPTCVCGNDRAVVTLYPDGSVGRWSVAP